MIVNMPNKEGVTLATQGKYCAENIEVVPTFEMSEGNTLNEFLKGTKTEITAEDLAGITQIRAHAFYASPIVSIDIPDGVTNIGNSAFEYCSSLTSVTIPDSVTSIGSYTFGYTESFEEVIIPDSVTTIGTNLFKRSQVKKVVFGNGITVLPDSIFEYGGLKEVVLGENITTIGNQVFVNCHMTEITIPAKVTKMGVRTFWNIGFEECICLPEIPPTISDTTFTNSTSKCTFRVPAGSVEAYKTAPNWIAYADQIVAIEE